MFLDLLGSVPWHLSPSCWVVVFRQSLSCFSDSGRDFRYPSGLCNGRKYLFRIIYDFSQSYEWSSTNQAHLWVWGGLRRFWPIRWASRFPQQGWSTHEHEFHWGEILQKKNFFRFILFQNLSIHMAGLLPQPPLQTCKNSIYFLLNLRPFKTFITIMSWPSWLCPMTSFSQKSQVRSR